ncbi:homoserine kinase [Qipengyuania zhejiangensis]|uniref:homoserine kinase n=1 Tax=Qipengyuania zhejiangensis TaxID=3077782 RepID=UPI002D78D764|nr:homoserine kinase [Qipengyuania sp. Z2]
MAVYTHLGAEELARLIASYDVGTLVSAKGIAEGVSNSNWLVETTTGRFILTMYERRIETSDLPFFLGLLDHLSDAGCPVPRTIHDSHGAAYRMVDGKAAALIEFLPGVSPTVPTPGQARAVGAALAQIHLAGLEFGHRRANGLDVHFNANALAQTDPALLAAIDPDLPLVIGMARDVARRWPSDLPVSIIHSDLFPDNVLMLGDRVSGMIDFYFACTDAMAYDLAVTHAAWAFGKDGAHYDAAVGRALIEGYETVRPLSDRERAELPVLAQGACLRFVASRTEDWIDTPADALVTRKDPMDFVRRWRFYGENGREAFA